MDAPSIHPANSPLVGLHTKGMEGEQSSTGAQGRKQERVENDIPVAIIHDVCKLFMMVLRENKWTGVRE